MSETTLITALENRLIAQTWTGSSNVVFGTGCVSIVPALTPDVVKAALNTMRVPMCLLGAGTAESDPEFNEEPDLIKFNFDCAIITAVPGDLYGRNAYMGANKTGGSTKSEGRGIAEIAVEMYNAIGKVNALESITMQARQTGQQGAMYNDRGLWMVWRVYQIEAWGVAT